MKTSFEITRMNRRKLLDVLENNTLEQLNKVPEGFSNNLIWNIAHIVVVQQMLVYKLSGLPMQISDAMVDTYKRGTKPEADVTADEVETIKQLLTSTIDQTEADYNAGIFRDYTDFTTMSGFVITNAQQAIEFNNYHEGIHAGIMLGIRKFI
ncbi:DinB family protein [Flavobacterium supellecticarium]|uniref:DinB family protein n=1 Tax=Flavobacterium supellecticarium TaxID=2565924 RepID=A0A4S3ZRG6_9FLAO|nr:DinB family protein [Flavobacterium supellecticarium]THF48161.1 DinB family protein [Flavobacterium supellecticarium]